MEYQSRGSWRRSAAARTSATARICSIWREALGSDLAILRVKSRQAVKVRRLRRERAGRSRARVSESLVPSDVAWLSVSGFSFILSSP